MDRITYLTAHSSRLVQVIATSWLAQLFSNVVNGQSWRWRVSMNTCCQQCASRTKFSREHITSFAVIGAHQVCVPEDPCPSIPILVHSSVKLALESHLIRKNRARMMNPRKNYTAIHRRTATIAPPFLCFPGNFFIDLYKNTTLGPLNRRKTSRITPWSFHGFNDRAHS